MLQPESARPATVVLVHGSLHGAWCWQRVGERLGRAAVPHLAVDLPGHGTREACWRSASMASYTACVVDAVDDAAGPVVLVGHSMAGQVVARAATTRPGRVALLVLLNAQVLRDGQTALSTLPPPRQLEYRRLAAQGGGRYRLDDEQIHRRWLHDVPTGSPLLAWALSRITAQPLAPLTEPADDQDFGAAGVPAAYLISADDVGNPVERARGFLRLLPAGTPIIGIPGGHDAMISQPDAVASVLIQAADGVPPTSIDGRRPVSLSAR